MKKISQFFLLMILASYIGISTGFACPDSIQKLQTSHLPASSGNLCQVYDRFEAARKQISKNGISNPQHISAILSPRFVNGPRWAKVQESLQYDPRQVFEPAPATFNAWIAAVDMLDQLAVKNISESKIAEISVSWIQNVHATATQGLLTHPGAFRNHVELGLALEKKYSLSLSQVAALQRVDYPSFDHPEKGLVSWFGTQCLEDRPESFIAEFQLTKQNGIYLDQWPQSAATFTDENGTVKQCGMIYYANFQEVQKQLSQLVDRTNQSFAQWSVGKTDDDPLIAAARLQRWFISIHPFLDGNGRTSRLLMDYVLTSLGLPAPHLAEQQHDLYHSEETWADEIGRGIVKALEAAEFCAANPIELKCREISAQ